MNRVIHTPVLAKVYVWKNDKIIKACFVFSDNHRSYLVLSDGKSNKEINEKIQNWATRGHKVTVGLPPAPMTLVKDIIDAVVLKK